LHFPRSEIDTPLKVSSVFGVISALLLLSSLAYSVLTSNQRPVDYSSPLTVSSVLFVGLINAAFVIIGSLAILFARMQADRRGILGFFVFIASVFAILGAIVAPFVPRP
jgi:hypothetical protein